MAPDNGTAGTSFTFNLSSITTGATLTVSVTGGTCSSTQSVDAGKWLINEDLSSGLWAMTGVTTQPAANLLAEKDSIGQAKVSTPSGTDTAVTFTDQPALATIKVCQWSRNPNLQGSQFSFTVGQSTVTAAAGASASTAGCSAAVPFQPGSKVTVVESVPSGFKVADVRVGGNATLANWKTPQAKVAVGIGVNTITFEDESLSPPQDGYVEVCKDAYDSFVNGTYHFEITDAAGNNLDRHADGTTGEDVPVQQCSGPIKVPIGNVTIAETVPANQALKGVFLGADSIGQLGVTNLTNGTATVVVPVSADPAGEVQVHFLNRSMMGTLKVCKYLTPSSSMLAGTTFTFDVQSAAGASTVTVVASASQNGACKSIPNLPIGTPVTVTEEGMPWVSADGGEQGAGETQTITLVCAVGQQEPCINMVSFTNQAIGQVEICKYMQTGDTAFNNTVFGFTVSGVSGTVQVAASKCSLPIVVPAGPVTITESSTPGFGFVSSTAAGPLGDNRATSGTPVNGLNPITVTVPWFASNDTINFGETVVTVVNSVYRAQLKICTAIAAGSTGSLGGTAFTYSILVNGAPPQNSPQTFTSQTPYPSCSGLMLNVPIIDPATGKPASIRVEQTSYTPTSMTVQNTAASPPVSFGAAYVMFAPGVGNDIVTFTNS